MKRIIDLEINLYDGSLENFKVYIGARELMFYEQETLKVLGKEHSFIQDLEKIQDLSMTTITMMISSTLHFVGRKQPVGFDFVDDNIDIMKNMEQIMKAIGGCLDDLNVKVDPTEKMGKQQSPKK